MGQDFGCFARKSLIYLFFRFFYIIFVLFSRRCSVHIQGRGWEYIYMEWRLLDVLFFGSTRTSQLLNPVRNMATVDVRWVCFMYALVISVWLHRVEGGIYTYRRGLLRCSFGLDWAMRRPL